jgi:hypothetical protein
MASPAPNNHAAFRPKREEIEFPPNVPVTVAIRYAIPKMVSGMSGERCLFTTPDNRVFFVSPEVAGMIEASGVNTGEPFTLTRHTDGKRGSTDTWEVARLAGHAGTADAHRQPSPATVRTAATTGAASDRQPQLGPQTDGTFAVPRDEDAPPPMRKGVQSAAQAASSLEDEANHLIDTFARVLHRGLTSYPGRLKPEEIKSIFLTIVINRYNGKGRAA